MQVEAIHDSNFESGMTKQHEQLKPSSILSRIDTSVNTSLRQDFLEGRDSLEGPLPSKDGHCIADVVLNEFELQERCECCREPKPWFIRRSGSS